MSCRMSWFGRDSTNSSSLVCLEAPGDMCVTPLLILNHSTNRPSTLDRGTSANNQIPSGVLGISQPDERLHAGVAIGRVPHSESQRRLKRPHPGYVRCYAGCRCPLCGVRSEEWQSGYLPHPHERTDANDRHARRAAGHWRPRPIPRAHVDLARCQHVPDYWTRRISPSLAE